MSLDKTVISLHERKPEEALENLRRLTGLDWREYPVSLVHNRADLGLAPMPVEQGGGRKSLKMNRR